MGMSRSGKPISVGLNPEYWVWGFKPEILALEGRGTGLRAERQLHYIVTLGQSEFHETCLRGKKLKITPMHYYW